MLNSIKENGGFYIGRYNVGSEKVYELFDCEKIHDKVYIRKNAYPVTTTNLKGAQTVIEQIKLKGRTVSLMFGLQWDLVMKYLITKGVLSKKDLINNANKYGNFSDSDYILENENADYTYWNLEDDGKKVHKISKLEPLISKDKKLIVLTEGANEDWKLNNIYDFLGNTGTYTLEHRLCNETPIITRGGRYNSEHIFYRNIKSDNIFGISYGIRPVLW